MKEFHIAAPEVNTIAELVAHLRADGKHNIADNILIGSGSLELRSDQSYHYSDELPSISEIKKERAFIRQQMIGLKTHPEEVTSERLDAIARALHKLLDYTLEHLEVD